MPLGKILVLLQSFFDGFVLSPEDVTHYTGEEGERAKQIYQAIQGLRRLRPDDMKDI